MTSDVLPAMSAEQVSEAGMTYRTSGTRTDGALAEDDDFAFHEDVDGHCGDEFDDDNSDDDDDDDEREGRRRDGVWNRWGGI